MPGRLMLAVALAVLGATVGASAAPAAPWVPNGEVTVLLRSGQTLYVGGQFNRIGPYTGGSARLDRASGALLAPWPAVEGVVLDIASDGAGGWYLAGEFTTVGGLPRAGLAHVLADHTVDPTFTPTTNGVVRTLLVRGPLIYAGGRFTEANGTARSNFAVFNSGGGLDSFNPGFSRPAPIPPDDPPATEGVQSLALDDTTVGGPILYVVGNFDTAGGVTRNSGAAFDLTTGVVTGWDPNMKFNTFIQPLLDVAVAPEGVYISGSFSTVNGNTVNRRGIARVNAGTGVVDAGWLPPALCCGQTVERIAVGSNVVYMAGLLQVAAGVTPTAAAVTRSTGGLAAWSPAITTKARTLAVDGDTVWIGGSFTTTSGAPPRQALAAVAASNGAVLDLAPASPAGEVRAIAVAGGELAVGGDFDVTGGVERNGLGAVDLTTGEATGFAPPLARLSQPEALVLAAGRLWVGGQFSTVGTERAFLVPFDPVTGAEGGEAVAPDGPVQALATDGTTVYFGGAFQNVGTPRAAAAALDANTGELLPFKPQFNGPVDALAVVGNKIFAGGAFTEVNGRVPRNNLAAVEPSIGEVLPFTPEPGGRVRTLVVDGATVYAGGDFTGKLAAFDAATSANLFTATGIDGNVFALSLSRRTLLAGGDFTTPGPGVAAFDAGSGGLLAPVAPTLFDEPNSGLFRYGKPIVNAVAAADTAIFGGDFLRRPDAINLDSAPLPVPAATATPTPTATATETATPPPSADTTGPVLSKLRAKPKRFRAAKRNTKPKGTIAKTKRGTKIRFTLSEPATVRFRLVAKVKRKKKARGRFVRSAPQGATKLVFTGRLKKRALRGKLTLVATPTDLAGNRGKARKVKLRIVR